MTQLRRMSHLVLLRLLAAAMIGCSVLILVVGLLVQRSREGLAGLEALAQIASVYAVLCPLLAVAIRGGGLLGEPVSEKHARSLLSRQVIYFGILESGAILCAVALMLTDVEWPLLAAAAPVAVMVISYPRGRSGPTRS